MSPETLPAQPEGRSQTPCHHSNSRKFICACGARSWWFAHSGINTIICRNCGRRHVRGKNCPEIHGYDKHRPPCEGVGK